MCGIAGIYNFSVSESVDPNVLNLMNGTMNHRGPDGGDIWISQDGKVGLAHKRLSIIDLSTSATQPMPNEDETVWLTYNGEVTTTQNFAKSFLKRVTPLKHTTVIQKLLFMGMKNGVLKNLSIRLKVIMDLRFGMKK